MSTLWEKTSGKASKIKRWHFRQLGRVGWEFPHLGLPNKAVLAGQQDPGIFLSLPPTVGVVGYVPAMQAVSDVGTDDLNSARTLTLQAFSRITSPASEHFSLILISCTSSQGLTSCTLYLPHETTWKGWRHYMSIFSWKPAVLTLKPSDPLSGRHRAFSCSAPCSPVGIQPPFSRMTSELPL